MTDLNELLSIIPIDQVAAQLGVDRATAQEGVAAAIPALLGGMEANAKDPAGEASLVKALATKDTTLADGAVDVSRVDVVDGGKIVRNVFGDRTDDVIATLGGAPGKQSEGLVAKLLPILAPIVLSFLAKKLLGGGTPAADPATGQAAGEAPHGSMGGGLGDILGGLLNGLGAGGQTSTPSSGGLGGGLGDLLGGMFGGGSSGSGGGGIGDLLGDLLGGGKR
ncbi:uncharacterized protein DUF937 [Salana multivorans]|uniref:Uncharacterized protein DUF937 n=1 Tax=Salana multivorans TaxID=120377 RepID=A0A3N2D9L4_9MICO|nr:DUF937 domain-containing protein [Salana multivorans]ROR96477.1 uncharacterized protein DUF937 [Salana multivorans]